MKNQNGCFNPGYKNLNLIQTQGLRNWCSSAHMKNWKIVQRMDNFQDDDEGWSNMNMIHVV
jgi:hypothetical protein